jgi:hypothetical protein
VDDVLLDVADLGGDDGAAVQARLERGHEAVARLVARAALVDHLGDEEDATKAVALSQAAPERPRHHRLVADVLIDPAVRLQDRRRDVVEEVVLELVEAHGPQRGGDRRGVVRVQEHEDAILGDGPVIAAEQQAHQRAGAAEHEVAVLLGRVVSEPAVVLGPAEQAHRHHVDGGGAHGDVEERPDEQQPAQREAAHEPWHQPQLEPGAAEPDGGAGGRCRQLAGQVRGHRTVCSARREITSGADATIPRRGVEDESLLDRPRNVRHHRRAP